MLQYKKFILPNGLRVIIGEDKNSLTATTNLLYNVGSKNDPQTHTGIAHLFEHLMFEGTPNIDDFDYIVSKVGGNSNAFTSQDVTNYHITLPANNIETAIWVEADRMKGINFTAENLNVQKGVVSEEFKEYHQNAPYGDMWHYLQAIAYTTHPYKNMVIGENLEHIQSIDLQQIKDFFYTYYRPNNCILSIVGGISAKKVMPLVEKWFGNIEPATLTPHRLPAEPPQTQSRKKTVKAPVPASALTLAFAICNRKHPNYHATELISDLLDGVSANSLHEALVKNNPIFSQIGAFISDTLDEGILCIQGNVLPEISIETAEQAIWNELQLLTNKQISDYEMQKLKNKVESHHVFADLRPEEKAYRLAFFELIGELEHINTEIDRYNAVTPKQIQQIAQQIFEPNKCNVLYYIAEK